MDMLWNAEFMPKTLRINFFPSTGKLKNFSIASGPGIRVDTGFEEGSEISMYYDPMIAKLVCWDIDRNSVIKRMNRALEEFEITGITHNINFLNTIMKNKNFIKGKFDIKFIEKEKIINNKLALKQKGSVSKKTAAYIFSALMYNQKAQNFISEKDSVDSQNFWTEQNYE